MTSLSGHSAFTMPFPCHSRGIEKLTFPLYKAWHCLLFLSSEMPLHSMGALKIN